jgi:hypothetical protein
MHENFMPFFEWPFNASFLLQNPTISGELFPKGGEFVPITRDRTGV